MNDLLNVYPNPNNGTFIIEYSSINSYENSNILIFDTFGKLVYKNNIDIISGNNKIYINNLNLESGTYIIKLIKNDNSIQRSRLIIF